MRLTWQAPHLGKVYGTTVGCAGCRSEITIAFAQKVSNFSVFLVNGRTVRLPTPSRTMRADRRR